MKARRASLMLSLRQRFRVIYQKSAESAEISEN